MSMLKCTLSNFILSICTHAHLTQNSLLQTSGFGPFSFFLKPFCLLPYYSTLPSSYVLNIFLPQYLGPCFKRIPPSLLPPEDSSILVSTLTSMWMGDRCTINPPYSLRYQCSTSSTPLKPNALCSFHQNHITSSPIPFLSLQEYCTSRPRWHHLWSPNPHPITHGDFHPSSYSLCHSSLAIPTSAVQALTST